MNSSLLTPNKASRAKCYCLILMNSILKRLKLFNFIWFFYYWWFLSRTSYVKIITISQSTLLLSTTILALLCYLIFYVASTRLHDTEGKWQLWFLYLNHGITFAKFNSGWTDRSEVIDWVPSLILYHSRVIRNTSMLMKLIDKIQLVGQISCRYCLAQQEDI